MTKEEVSLCQRYFEMVKAAPVSYALTLGYARLARNVGVLDSRKLWWLFGDNNERVSLQLSDTSKTWQDVFDQKESSWLMTRYFEKHDFQIVLAGKNKDVWPVGVYVCEDALIVWFKCSERFKIDAMGTSLGRCAGIDCELGCLRAVFALPKHGEELKVLISVRSGRKATIYRASLYPRTRTSSYRFMRLECPDGGMLDLYNCVRIEAVAETSA